MTFVYPDINKVFKTDSRMINTIVIENQNLLYSLVNDINNQINGLDGKSVLSDNGKIIPINKNMELITQFVPFEINQKNLINKISSELEKEAIKDYNYADTIDIISKVESLLYKLAFNFSSDIIFTKINIASIIKASGIEINDSYSSLGEKLLDYIEMVNEFLGRKLFVFVNLRSYISNDEFELLLETAINHSYNLIMIENKEYKIVPYEERIIIDSDLCEIIL